MMLQKTIRKIVLGAALLAGGMLPVPVGAKNLSVTITDANGRPVSGFLVGATAEALRIAANEKGQGIKEMTLDQIENISFNETPDGWGEALNQFRAKDFANAERGFTKLAEELRNIALLRDEYGAMARYYQLACLKQNGKLAQLAKALGELRSSPIALGDYYMGELIRLRPWGLVGKEDWDGVLAYVAGHQEAGDGPRPRYKAELSRSQIAEISYLAGVAQARKGEKEASLENLYRALTLNNGNDLLLSKAAITEALEQLKEADSDELKREAYAIAAYYRDAIGKGSVDPAYMHLLKEPPRPATEPEATEPEAAAATEPEAAESVEAAEEAE